MWHLFCPCVDWWSFLSCVNYVRLGSLRVGNYFFGMIQDDTIEVNLNELRAVALENLKVLGLTVDESEVVADVLLYAELRDKSQGLIKMATQAWLY